MAVIQYSALVTQLRGKLGGSQFNKGHAGYSLQRKSTPTIRRTPAQLRWRQTISLIQRSWKNESAVRKNQATQAALSNPTTDRFGQQVVLSGYNQYVKIMSWRSSVVGGQPPLPLNRPILATPVNSALLSLPVLSIFISGVDVNGHTNFVWSAERITTGTPTGTTSDTRSYVFITRVDAGGNPMPGARPVYIRYLGYNDEPFSDVNGYFQSSEYFNNGDRVLVEVRTRHTGAGAETGYWSNVITLG